MYPRNVLQKGCRRTFEGDCTAIYARFVQSPVDCGCVTKLPQDDLADSIICGLQKTVLRTPKDDSSGA